MWSWRGSNPRPNGVTVRFLHAYPRLLFRAPARPGPPTDALVHKCFSQKMKDAPLAIPDIAAPPVSVSLKERALGGVSFPYLVRE